MKIDLLFTRSTDDRERFTGIFACDSLVVDSLVMCLLRVGESIVSTQVARIFFHLSLSLFEVGPSRMSKESRGEMLALQVLFEFLSSLI